MAIILSIVPYKFLPPVNGGHWGVYMAEKILSVNNETHSITTQNNEPGDKTYPFQPHLVLPSSKARYIPFSQFNRVWHLARSIRPDYIFCHHHYMYPLARKIANRLNIPVYIRAYNIESERFKTLGKWWWKIMELYERRCLQNADAVFFITKDDRDWAVNNFLLKGKKAIVMPHSIDFKGVPQIEDNAKEKISSIYGLDKNIPWFYFMGMLDYKPNEDAVKVILEELLPLLKKQLPSFHILICGKNLSKQLQNAIENSNDKEIIRYLGFVPDINAVIASCAVMLNPVVAGGGVKIKVLESLSWNKSVVSTYSGAIGVEQSVCGNKLLISEDYNWEAFVDLVLKAMETSADKIPDTYFEHYNIQNIASRIKQFFLPDIP
jgi:glycosyltransferase involved in cell wall biosynthesis